MRVITNEVGNLIGFLNFSPTAFHATDNAAALLKKSGFIELYGRNNWKLQPGGKYFVRTNGSAITAFINSISKEVSGFKIVGAHTDSPGVKIKPNPEFVKEGFLQLNTEIYGGPILSTWFDRPLAIAGRVFIKGKDTFNPVQKLVNIKKPIAIIPNLAIHMNREINNGYAINNQKDIIPILIAGLDDKFASANYLLKMVASELKIKAEQIVDFDLFLYEYCEAMIIGPYEDMISSSRLDDLQAVCAGLDALLNAKPGRHVKVLACFDNEEVGNATKQGADSLLLCNMIERIILANGGTPEDLYKATENSFMISVDGAHSIHPNRAEKYDPINKPQINKGPVIKISANQKYTSDAESSSVIKILAEKAGVPIQVFVNNSNEKGGSTIGPISSKYLQIKAVDIGVPMLAMHSIRELIGTKDHNMMIKLLSYFYK